MSFDDEELTFWVGIPHEALCVLGEKYPEIADFLGFVAAVFIEPPLNEPPKSWVRGIYQQRVVARKA